jgi:predicted DNA-binding transcriptional regulator AlpA
MGPEEAVITPAQAMQILGITCRTTFWKVVYQQKIPHLRVPGTRVIKFERQEIERRKELWMVRTTEDLRASINGRRMS